MFENFKDKPTLFRVNKEIASLNNNYYNCKLLINKNYIDIYIPIKLNDCKHVMTLIRIGKSYPFEVPNVFVNNIEYYKLLKQISIKNCCNDMCLCCKSITCPNKWKPTFKIHNILSEIFNLQSQIINFLPVDGYD